VGEIFLNIGFVLLLIVIEGVFVASEFALVGLREGQVKSLGEKGRRGAAVARLVSNPNRYLGIVQVLITLTALLSAAVGAETLARDARRGLIHAGVSEAWAGAIGFFGVTLLIAFVTLVIGEQLPKRLGMQRAEGTALLVAPTLDRLATLLKPVLWLIAVCTDGLVRIFGGNPALGHEPISEDELRGLVAAHESLTPDERRLIDEVFDAGGRSVGEVMVPRTEVVFLDATLTVSRAARIAAETAHPRYPVVGESQDDVIGYVALLDLLLPEGNAAAARDRTVGDLSRPIKAMPATKPVLAALSEMRLEGQRIALVVDEYGGTDGIVTLVDLVEEIVGDVRGEDGRAESVASILVGGAVEVDGKANLDEVAEVSGLELPEGPYATLAGFVMAALGRIPELGDEVRYDGYQLAVSAVDGRHAARVTVSRRPEGHAASPAATIPASAVHDEVASTETAAPADESMGHHG
jgi:putative hemolysin